MTDQRLTAARQDLLKLSNEISGRLKQTKDRRRAETFAGFMKSGPCSIRRMATQAKQVGP